MRHGAMINRRSSSVYATTYISWIPVDDFIVDCQTLKGSVHASVRVGYSWRLVYVPAIV